MPVKLFAKKLVEEIWGGELIQEEIKEQELMEEEQLPISLPSQISQSSSNSSSTSGDDTFPDEHYGIMDVASAALTSFMEEDDDHFLFPTDQLEEELATANQEMMTATSTTTTTEVQEETDNHTVAESVMSVPSLQTAVTTSTTSSRSTRGERAKRRLQLSPEPALQAEPAATTTTTTSKTTPAASTSTKKKTTAKKKASAKRKVEPLAKQVIPGSGRGARQKMFSWDDRMVQLQDYKDQFGHIVIPTVRRDPYYNLGLWLAAQRSLYRKNSLRKERLGDLRKLGCVGFGGPGG